MLRPATNILAELPPRLVAPAVADNSNEFMDVYIEEGQCLTLPLPPVLPPATQKVRACPTGAQCGSTEFARYMAELNNHPAQLAKSEQTNMYCAFGRTRGGHSVALLAPCPVMVCYELPDTLDGNTRTSDTQVADFCRQVLVRLQRELADDYAARQAEAAEMGRSHHWMYPREPRIDFKWTFAWRARSSGWQPQHGNAQSTEELKVPVIQFELVNDWAYYRLVLLLETARDLRCAGCIVQGQLWETKDQFKTDLRYRIDHDVPAAGWARIAMSGAQPPSWRVTHCDSEFYFATGLNVIENTNTDTNPVVCKLAFDIECINGSAEEFAQMQRSGRNRFPDATIANNCITVIGIVVVTADGRRVHIALEHDDRCVYGQTMTSTHTFERQNHKIEFVRFLIQDERKLLLALRDIVVFYDPTLIASWNGDGFDWPFLCVRMGDPERNWAHRRFYHLGRVIAQDWTRQTLVGFVDAHDQFTPVFSKDKPATAVRRTLGVWQVGRYNQATVTPQLAGRFSCDMLVLFDRCLRGIPEYTFKSLRLDDVAEALLGYNKMKTDLFGNWHGMSSLHGGLPIADQRLQLVQYCVWDTMLPMLMLEMKQSSMVSYVMTVARITGARVHDVVNRGQLARIGAMFTDVAHSRKYNRNYVLTYSLAPLFEYEGAIVLNPTPQSFVGVAAETAQLHPDQRPLDSTQYDWAPVVTKADGTAFVDINNNNNNPNLYGCTFGKADPATYDAATQTLQATMTDTAGKQHCVRVPARFVNTSFVVTLDFQSLYPSVIALLNLSPDTIHNPADPLNRAEICAVRARARFQFLLQSSAATPAEILACMDAAEASAHAARAQRTLNYVVDADSPEACDVSGGPSIPSTHNNNNDNNSNDTDDFPSNEDDVATTTSTYVPGDGDRTADAPTDRWPKQMHDNFYIVQVSVPNKSNVRREKRVHLSTQPHVRKGILPEIIARCLDMRAYHKKLLGAHKKDLNKFATVCADDIAAARAHSCGCTAVCKLCVLRDCPDLSSSDDVVNLHKQVMRHPRVVRLQEDIVQQDVLQLAFKLIANSAYGASGNKMERSCIGSAAVAESTTAVSRQKIMFSKDTVMQHFCSAYPLSPHSTSANIDAHGLAGAVCDVIYGDTDSIFVHVECRDADMAMKFAKHISKHINDLFRSQYGAKSSLNLQAECVKRFMTLAQMKNYWCDQRDDGSEFWHPKMKGVATVRRDRPAVLTELLRRVYACTSDLGEYSRSVCRTMIMRIVWEFMEKMVANELSLNMYEVTQRINKLPRVGVKPAPHVAVALEMCRRDKVPVRIGDTSTYVLVRGAGAAAASEATLDQVDRTTYFVARMSTNMAKTLRPLMGSDNPMTLILATYTAALQQKRDLRQMFSNVSDRREFRWRQLAAAAAQTHTLTSLAQKATTTKPAPKRARKLDF